VRIFPTSTWPQPRIRAFKSSCTNLNRSPVAHAPSAGAGETWESTDANRALTLSMALPVLAAPYSTISVTFAVCDTDAEVVVTVMVYVCGL
jgi:hypothetical protein